MYITLIVLFLSAIFFMSGKVRSDLVALFALVLLIIIGILTPEEALTGFSNSVVIMMIGLFVVGGAIFQTGLAKMISSRILKLAGDSELKLFILIVLVTAFIGAFVSNTGTVALMLPIVVSMAMGTQINVSRLLMPLAFASSMGSMMTLIGTPPNLVIQEALTSAGYAPLTPPNFGHGMLFRTLDGEWMMSVHSHKDVNGRYIRIPHLFKVDLSGDKLKID